MMRRTVLHIFLLIEWPILAVALGLSSWGLWSLCDALRFNQLAGTPEGFESGDYGFNYGTQLVSFTSTRTSTSTGPDGVKTTITTATQPTRTLYPYAHGTIAYTSIYSLIGSIPPPVTSLTTSSTHSTSATATGTGATNTAAAAQPTREPSSSIVRRDDDAHAPFRRRSWSDNSGTYYHGLYNVYGDAPGYLGGLITCFAFVVAAFAVRLLLTPVYLLHGARQTSSHKTRHGWAVALVTVFTLAVIIVLGAGIAGFVLYADYYDETIPGAPGLIVTIVFWALASLTSIVALIMACVELHRIKTLGPAQADDRHRYLKETTVDRCDSDGASV